MRRKNLNILIPGFIFLLGCSIYNKTEDSVNKLFWSVNFGKAKGGFIEETKTDAISGATLTKNYLGLRTGYKMSNKNSLETGVDIVPHKQTISYHDPVSNINGSIDFNYTRISLPFVYSYGALTNNFPKVYLNAGITINFIHPNKIIVKGCVPKYSLSKVAISPQFGITIIPFQLFEKYLFGLHFNTSLIYGTKIFKDEIYHKASNTGLLSTVEFGISLFHFHHQNNK